MSNKDIEAKVSVVDEALKTRAKALLVAKGYRPVMDWFMDIFKSEPEEVAKRIYKSEELRYDIPIICFQIRGDDDPWTQRLCDELETLYCEKEGK